MTRLHYTPLAPLIALSCLLAVCGCSSRPPAVTELAPAREPTRRLWLEDREGSPPSPVVNGKPTRFILDTGVEAPFVLFDHALHRFEAEPLGTPEEGERPGTFVFVKTKPLPVSFLGTSAEVPFAVVKLPPWINPELDGVGDGLIGGPIANSAPWIFDTANHVFAPVAEIPEAVQTWVTFELTDRKVLVIKTPPTEKLQYLYIDTGNSQGVRLPPAAWKSWKQKNPGAPITLSMSWFGELGDGVTS